MNFERLCTKYYNTFQIDSGSGNGIKCFFYPSSAVGLLVLSCSLWTSTSDVICCVDDAGDELADASLNCVCGLMKCSCLYWNTYLGTHSLGKIKLNTKHVQSLYLHVRRETNKKLIQAKRNTIYTQTTSIHSSLTSFDWILCK